MTLKELAVRTSLFQDTPIVPALFLGHGTPMNAIDNNEFTQRWVQLSEH